MNNNNNKNTHFVNCDADGGRAKTNTFKLDFIIIFYVGILLFIGMSGHAMRHDDGIFLCHKNKNKHFIPFIVWVCMHAFMCVCVRVYLDLAHSIDSRIFSNVNEH